jgi:hypothetical protein
MAGSKSDYMEDKVMNVLRGTTFTGVTPYVGLMTAAPGETGPGTEVSGGSYARTAVTFGAPSGGAMSNSGAVNFPTPTADWGTIVGFGIFDASTSGNLLYYGDITPNQTINTGNTVTFPTGDIDISES